MGAYLDGMYEHTKIEIRYGTIVNGRGKEHGWLPQVWEDGHALMSSWSGYGYERDVALDMAQQRAVDAADRYVGDWDISVEAA